MGKALELPQAERIRIAESLFHVTDTDGNRCEMHGLCPFHEEGNPSFSYNYEKDVYHCLAGCSDDGDLVKLWSHVKGYADNRAGFKAFCHEFGIGVTGGSGKTPAPLASAAKEKIPAKTKKNMPPLDAEYAQMAALPAGWVQRLAQARGWSAEAMDALGLRMQSFYAPKSGGLKPVRNPERIVIPIPDASGAIRNMRLYKPGAAEMKIISWGSAFGSARLFPPTPQPEGVVLLCEGEPDTICAISHGFNAITQTSKPKKWLREHLEPFRGRDVVIAFDADQPGQKYATEFAAPELATVARSLRILEWPDFMGRRTDGMWPEDHGQDLTDFFVKHGKSADDLQFLIDKAEPFGDMAEDDAPPTDSQALDFFDRGVNDRLSFKPRLLADRLLEKFQLMSDPMTGLLYRWQGQMWERMDSEYLEAVATRMLGMESQKSRVIDAVYQATILSTIEKGRAVNDRADDWLNVRNGMLNIRTLELVPHDPDFFSTYQIDADFNPDSPARCERWLRFLDETIQAPGPIAQLQEFFGYCLTRETKYSKVLILVGPGADGKSKILHMLRDLVGHDNCSAVSFGDLEDQFQRADLYERSVNISTEIGSKALESQYFKAISSGDPISASFKYKHPFTFTPFAKLVFATNKLPRVLDNTDGYFRRLLPIKFSQQFLEEDPRTDPDLYPKLRAEMSEIFHWALAGLHRLWAQKRFSDCDATRGVMMEYRRQNNPVLCFIDDMCCIDPNLSTNKANLYESYVRYCTANGYSSMNSENFFRELYVAIKNLQTCRPRVNGTREYHIKGIYLGQGENFA